MKISAFLVSLVIILFSQFGTVLAYDLPIFTSCVNPLGEIKASYDSGVHGIAGMSNSFSGKDTVYKLSDNALTQCFCPENGAGIQTNWLKASNLTESDIKVLVSRGWIYIPNGSLWGLDKDPYLALNSDFSCKSSSGGGGGTSSSGGSSSSSSSNNSGGGSGGVGGVAGGVGQVLGLASTGNTVFMLGVALTSGLSLLSGLIIKLRVKKSSE